MKRKFSFKKKHTILTQEDQTNIETINTKDPSTSESPNPSEHSPATKIECNTNPNSRS